MGLRVLIALVVLLAAPAFAQNLQPIPKLTARVTDLNLVELSARRRMGRRFR
jgi:hypothetical protein